MAPATGTPEIAAPWAARVETRRRAAGPDEDRILLGRIRDGDRAALDLLIERHRVALWRFSCRLTGDGAEADDLAQETMVRALRALEGFRGDAAFRTWLLRIASNLWIETATRAENRRRDGRTAEEIDPAVPPGLEEHMARSEQSRRLRRAVSALPPRQRATLVLKVYQDLTLKEVAAVLDCPVGTAKANYHHALTRLRRELDPAAADPAAPAPGGVR